MLLVLGIFLYARYAQLLWSVIQICGAVCVGLAVPIALIAAANWGDLRQAAAWWTLTGGSLAIGAIGALFAPGFALSQTPEWLLKAAATAPGAEVPSILNLPKAFYFVSHLPNPQLDVLWLGLQALGAVALCVALCLQVIRLAMVLVGGASDRPPAFLRKLQSGSHHLHRAAFHLPWTGRGSRIATSVARIGERLFIIGGDRRGDHPQVSGPRLRRSTGLHRARARAPHEHDRRLMSELPPPRTLGRLIDACCAAMMAGAPLRSIAGKCRHR